MALAALIPVPISCEMCGGRPFVVSVPMRAVPTGSDGITVDVDSDHLRAAVRAHVRQHQN